MEYLLVVAFGFLLLVPIVLISMTQSSRFTSDVTAAQIQKVGRELTDAVDSVYYAGPPTKRTMQLYFPVGIRNVTLSNSTIIFRVSGSSGAYDYPVFAATNVTGELRTFAGVHRITLEAGDTNVTLSD